MNVRYSPAVTLKPPVQEALGSQSLGLLSAVFFFVYIFLLPWEQHIGRAKFQGTQNLLCLLPQFLAEKKKKSTHLLSSSFPEKETA
jgi:hypothetical protein